MAAVVVMTVVTPVAAMVAAIVAMVAAVAPVAATVAVVCETVGIRIAAAVGADRSGVVAICISALFWITLIRSSRCSGESR